MKPPSDEKRRLRDDPDLREDLRRRLDRYLDLPLALASVLLILIAVIELGGEPSGPWSGRLMVLGWVLWGLFFAEFVAKFVLAPNKRAYLKHHPLDLLVLLVPFLRFLRVLRVLRATRAFPVFRLLVFGGRGSGAALVLLRRRRLGQLALVSVIVVLIGAAAGFALEAGAPGAVITDLGDALWWSAALLTTVGSELYPVTAAGRVLGFLLMLYAVGVFSYLIASVASILVGLDAGEARQEEAPPRGKSVRITADEVETLRRIVDKTRE
ncbi:potassium channel family protein [Rubrobacter marinus]|uniref:potassium channel family protein n=1 Tax=Rubrobacter marinus TaxID=2653852 RepID=UPI00140936B6|nr:potassium channel family protein [Rubrobacter marinus]